MEQYIYSVNIDDISIDEAELALRLNIPKGFTNHTIEECISAVKSSSTPKCCYMRVPLSLKEGRVDFEFASIESADLCKNLADCREAYVMAITLGIEIDRLINRMSLISKTRGFVADAVASAMAETLIQKLNDYLKESTSLRPRFSPGYGDLELSVQKDVLSVLNADKFLGIKLGDNLVMTPRKSITAICGIKE